MLLGAERGGVSILENASLVCWNAASELAPRGLGKRVCASLGWGGPARAEGAFGSRLSAADGRMRRMRVEDREEATEQEGRVQFLQ